MQPGVGAFFQFSHSLVSGPEPGLMPLRLPACARLTALLRDGAGEMGEGWRMGA